MHKVVTPQILFLGTPVVLISTMNEDGFVNLAPMSSAWWLDQTGFLGLGTRGQTFANLRRAGECILNLRSSDLAAVDRLAPMTGSDPATDYKVAMGFRDVRNTFDEAGLTAVPADAVRPPRIRPGPIYLEENVKEIHLVGRPDDHSGCIEVEDLRVHVEEGMFDRTFPHHILPDHWRPLIINFLSFFGLSDRVHGSRLGEVF